jgi:hypothetical protein
MLYQQNINFVFFREKALICKKIKNMIGKINESRSFLVETNKQNMEVQNRINKASDKWGSPPEVMAIPTIYEILFEQFNFSTVSKNLYKSMDDEVIEIDVFGFEDTILNTSIIVQINKHLREFSIEQLEETCQNFSKFFPDHANKKLFGMIACVHAPESLRNMLRKKGIYLAVLNDDTFSLYNFKNFIPTDFNLKRA